MSDHSTSEARALLRDLVETRSVSGSEDEVARRLRSFFRAHDREAYVDEVGNLRAPADDGVLLTSHMDTVPGEIPVRVEDDVLWGRGSVDAKGPLAAMAVAAVNAGVSFVGVVREETDSAGARHLVETRDPPAAIINGEPSGWSEITLGYRGFLTGAYTVETEVGHTSRPEPNAIQHAVSWWNRVESSLAGGETAFESVTPKPVEFEGGTSDDGLSFEARIDAQFRIPPDETADSVRETVPGVDPGTIEWTDSIPPVMESPRNRVAGALRRGIRTVGGDPGHLRKTGTSDMNVYAGSWEVPMATYGPGDSALDHTPEEHLDLAEFDRAVTVLSTAASSLATEP
ncbi:MAG: [LysW]-lysine hydrolase [Halodesulfurarchaeum sp.]